jgi:hypothetical protein
MEDKKVSKIGLFILLFICVGLFACNSSFKALSDLLEQYSYSETIAQINLCTTRDGKRIQVDELFKSFPRYICGTTNQPGRDYDIMIYDSYNQPVYGYFVDDAEAVFEIQIKDKLEPGQYRMEITGGKKVLDSIEFIILDKPQ